VIVPVRRPPHGQIGGVEQFEGGLFQRTFGEHKRKHDQDLSHNERLREVNGIGRRTPAEAGLKSGGHAG
jgi:hypothetical protein